METLEAARAAHARREYAVAFRMLSDLGADTLAADDLALLADAAWWLGRVPDVLRLTETLHERYLREGRTDRAAFHALDLAGVLMMSGRHAIAMGWLNRGRRLAVGLPRCAAHGVLTYVEATEALAGQRLDDATAAGGRLEELGRDLDDPTYSALGLLVEGLAEIRRGHLEPGFGLLDEAMLPVLADRVEPAWAGHVYCTIVSTCIALADLERAREWAAATERWVATFSAAVMFVGVCRAHRVELCVAEGELASAEAEARLVARELADLNAEAVAEADYLLGEACRLRGELATARGHYERAAVAGRPAQPGLALLALAAGDVDEAWTEICAAVGEGAEPFGCARLLRAQVRIGLAAGQRATASAAARRLRELADTYPTPGFAAWADEAVGLLLVVQGRPAEALPLLRRAAAGHRRIGATVDRAAVEVALAEAHRALGDPIAAEACASTARAIFAQRGIPAPEGAAQLSPVPAGGLTARETEVLLRIVTGASNRDAAAALGISEATLRRHLANIYAKLGVGSRTAAAAWAHEQGLVAG